MARVEKTFSYRLASKLIKENGEVQVATLVYCMGSEAENVYETFDLSDDDQKTFYTSWRSLMITLYRKET